MSWHAPIPNPILLPNNVVVVLFTHQIELHGLKSIVRMYQTEAKLRELDHCNDPDGPKWIIKRNENDSNGAKLIIKMSQMNQNQWA